MIPAAFDYREARSVAHAVQLLAEHGEDAKVLAGGHSLLPLMKLRLASPALLVDIGRIDALRGIRHAGGELRIGATTTHDEVLTSPLVARHCGLLAEVARLVADPQVRHRGTLGGALAHGDAAGDFPAAVVALAATLVVTGPDGDRVLPAEDFFRGYLETALGPDELLVEVRVPTAADDRRWAYEKFSRVSHMWATAGACVVLRLDGDRIAAARIGLTNMGAVPVRARAAEGALTGRGRDAVAAAAELADRESDPPDDLGGAPDYRRHLARVLTRRALERCLSADRPGRPR